MGLQNLLGFKGINPALRNIAVSYNTRGLLSKKNKKKVIKDMRNAMNEMVRNQDSRGLQDLMFMVKPSMSKKSQGLIEELGAINK